MTYRAIFFDAFGTLILWEESLSQRLARVGLSVSPEKAADILKRWEGHLAEKVEGEPGFATLAVERNRPFWDYFYTYLLREAGIEGDLSNYITGMYEGFLDDESLYPDPEALELLSRFDFGDDLQRPEAAERSLSEDEAGSGPHRHLSGGRGREARPSHLSRCPQQGGSETGGSGICGRRLQQRRPRG